MGVCTIFAETCSRAKRWQVALRAKIVRTLGDYSVFTFQPLALLLIAVVPTRAVCMTCQGPLTNCGGKTVDVKPALLCFELNAAGVISSIEGEAHCKI